jgi:drug/metabolite transporter (DMT)-like permease
MPSNPSGLVWLLGAAVSGALAAVLLRRGVGLPAVCIALGFVLAVGGRVAVETTTDPTSHNLWPFEVVIAGGIGLVGALLGVLLVRGVERVRRLRGWS